MQTKVDNDKSAVSAIFFESMIGLGPKTTMARPYMILRGQKTEHIEKTDNTFNVDTT